MCGIFGVTQTDKNASEVTYRGLERLEYRGYDSVGISVLSGGAITTFKRGGRVSSIEEQALAAEGSVAIGHTRWATHGAPSDKNAHPHVQGRFSLVHNGIIENWRELKSELLSDGESFLSDTDSEVIVKLVDGFYTLYAPSRPDDPLNAALSAVARAVSLLKGSYALGIICSDVEGIIAVKYKSPVVVGYMDGGTVLCSDIPALPEGVKSVCFPEDGDIVLITADGTRCFDGNLNPVNRVRSGICAGQLAFGKGNYPHFMIKEIAENCRTVRETVEGFFRYADVKKLKNLVKNADRIIITGCGTAYNAGLIAKRFFEERGAFCSVEIASELRYNLPNVTARTLVVAVSQSGETADTVEAVSALKGAGAQVVAVTNCGYSAITRVAHLVVPVCAGAEVCVAATKSYLGQICALQLTAKLQGDIFATRTEILSMCGKIEEVFCDGSAVGSPADDIASACAAARAVFFLGRGTDYAVAVEASLKLKEISYLFSDGYPAGELKHGTLALIDDDTLSVFVICNGELAEKCKNGVSQVTSRGGKVAVITTLSSVAEELAETAIVWKLPDCTPALAPYLSATALQLIAYKTAVTLGRDPDKPRNLAKSVTVE